MTRNSTSVQILGFAKDTEATNPEFLVSNPQDRRSSVNPSSANCVSKCRGQREEVDSDA